MKALFLACDQHGKSPWSGQVMCLDCGAAWHLNVDDPPTAPLCTCGAQLGTRGPAGERIESRARAICARCYRLKKAQRGGPS
jgi:hypothetical protein